MRHQLEGWAVVSIRSGKTVVHVGADVLPFGIGLDHVPVVVLLEFDGQKLVNVVCGDTAVGGNPQDTVFLLNGGCSGNLADVFTGVGIDLLPERLLCAGAFRHETAVAGLGFLPLFSNNVPLFSLEERTPAEDWWTGGTEDPWDWRMILAADEDIAYGKFFDRKAGFVSKEWFPDFANLRRDGYDWEGMYEDGKMKRRNRQVLEALEIDEESRGRTLLSCDLKKKAGLPKGFEGALSELQMQTFVIMGAFRQRINKQGQPYGWHVAEILTPETKWGYGHVNGAGRTPAESGERILEHLGETFPGYEKELARLITGRKEGTPA